MVKFLISLWDFNILGSGEWDERVTAAKAKCDFASTVNSECAQDRHVALVLSSNTKSADLRESSLGIRGKLEARIKSLTAMNNFIFFQNGGRVRNVQLFCDFNIPLLGR